MIDLAGRVCVCYYVLCKKWSLNSTPLNSPRRFLVPSLCLDVARVDNSGSPCDIERIPGVFLGVREKPTAAADARARGRGYRSRHTHDRLSNGDTSHEQRERGEATKQTQQRGNLENPQ